MPPLVIGHRGFPSRHPDNSLAGIAAALEVGADGVEVDIRPSAEGVWVCHHDLGFQGRPVRRWGAAELEGAGVPSLEAVVRAVPRDRWLFVEVKPVAAAVLRAGMEALRRLLLPRRDRTLVISFSPAALAAVGAEIPELRRSWVIDRLPAGGVPEGVALSPFHRLVEALLPTGVPLHPWAPSTRARLAELAGSGVASITTNRPDLLLEVLRG